MTYEDLHALNLTVNISGHRQWEAVRSKQEKKKTKRDTNAVSAKEKTPRFITKNQNKIFMKSHIQYEFSSKSLEDN